MCSPAGVFLWIIIIIVIIIIIAAAAYPHSGGWYNNDAGGGVAIAIILFVIFFFILIALLAWPAWGEDEGLIINRGYAKDEVVETTMIKGIDVDSGKTNSYTVLFPESRFENMSKMHCNVFFSPIRINSI